MNQPQLQVQLGRLSLPNPVLVASGTFGYAREMEQIVDLTRLGGIVPKTVTPQPRAGNNPWRTVETSSGLLNSIGLDNDGIEAFIQHHLPYLSEINSKLIVSIAAPDAESYASMAGQLEKAGGVDAIELNISCPNVSGGVDFGTNPEACQNVVSCVRNVTDIPILAKLTPNVANIVSVAQGAKDGGADAVCLTNTLLGMAIDWRKRRPLLGNDMGGLSGPAIKPVSLRCVFQVSRAVDIPIIGIGGIASLDDVMQFLVAGATAIQIGTANYYDPTITMKILDELPAALAEIDAASVSEIVGTVISNKSQ